MKSSPRFELILIILLIVLTVIVLPLEIAFVNGKLSITPVRVVGYSMVPTLNPEDRLFIKVLKSSPDEIRRGDIVTFCVPIFGDIIVKRVIGLPGDELRFEDGKVWINDKRLQEPYVFYPDFEVRLVTHVSPDHYFVLGDNRAASADSRGFGAVSRECIEGKVTMRIWPPTAIGAIN